MASEPVVKIDRRRRPKLPKQVVGHELLRPIQHLLKQLRPADPHPNQRLFLPDLLTAHLLAFFNPVVRSLRMIEDLAKTPHVQKVVSLDRLPKSTLSDAHRLCDPTLLQPIFEHLIASLPKGAALPENLRELARHVVAVDGTYFQAFADLLIGIHQRRCNGKPKTAVGMVLHLDVVTHSPLHVELRDRTASEGELARRYIRKGDIYLYDCGFTNFALMRDLIEGQADFVLRVNSQICFTVMEERPLSDADRKAGVLSDRVGVLTGKSRDSAAPTAMIREVLIAQEGKPDEPLRLLTTLLDLPAHQIGLLYRQRWQIELFFRWLKVYANFDRLFSHDRNGLMLSFYVAVIGTLLLCLRQNRKPNLYDISLLSLVADGSATFEDILPIMENRARECELARISQQKRRTKAALAKAQALQPNP